MSLPSLPLAADGEDNNENENGCGDGGVITNITTTTTTKPYGARWMQQESIHEHWCNSGATSVASYTHTH